MPSLNPVDNLPRRAAAIGMFDGVHCGHLHLIDTLCRNADKRHLTPTIVTFSRHPLATLRPDICPQALDAPQQRISQLHAAGIVDVIMLDFTPQLAAMSARDFMTMLAERYNVGYLLVGFNHRFGAGRSESVDDYISYGKQLGMEVEVATECDSDRPISSSAIRAAISSGRVDEAARMLGHYYSLDGTIKTGQQLGRTIGFPTANLHPDHKEKLIPQRGVYACRATTHSGHSYAAMVNIGCRPTVTDGAGETTIEAHLLNYSGNLYGQSLTLEFIKRLRDEKTFPTLSQLQSQLADDAAHTLRLLSQPQKKMP